MLESHKVTSSDGSELHVDEAGEKDGTPILFIHGGFQCRLSWDKQMNSSLANEFRLVAMDLRGHGLSDKPQDPYDDSQIWADDVQAVIDGLDLSETVLVAHSYGGLVTFDYLNHYGEGHILGINLADCISAIGTEDSNLANDPGTENTSLSSDAPATQVIADAHTSNDAEERINALDDFIRLITYKELSPQEHYLMLGYNALCPPRVTTKAMASRKENHDNLLSEIESPVLISYGENDALVTLDEAKKFEENIPTNQLSLYPEAGHSPLWENPDRFNSELGEFVREI